MTLRPARSRASTRLASGSQTPPGQARALDAVLSAAVQGRRVTLG